MTSKQERGLGEGQELAAAWPLGYEVTLGSSVRAQGIFLEVRARLPSTARKALRITARQLILRMPPTSEGEFHVTSRIVSEALESIEGLPVIPREIQDILGISANERHRWLKDGRLPSAGTRTVKLRGRAKAVTFHVFDPSVVEDLLDGDLIAVWREADAATAAENRRRAAWKAKMTRSLKGDGKTHPVSKNTPDGVSGPGLLGWEEFERDGPLR